jgi:type IV pilus assembly protein PilB
MGVEQFLLGSSLAGIVSQRLVRQLCPKCRKSYRLNEETAVRLGIPEQSGQEFYEASGCNMCRQLGYQGRIGLYEIMSVGPQLRQVISRGGNSEDFLSGTAIEEGMVAIKDDGISKAKQGLTTLEEVMKVVLLGG